MTLQTEHLYVVKDDEILAGEPIIKATRTSVRAIAEYWRMGMQPEEIVEGLPHLTLSGRPEAGTASGSACSRETG